MKFLAVLTLAGVFITSTSAHGGVTEYVIGGKTILGWQPYNSPNGQSTIQRQWSTYDPLYQASDSKSKCNTPGTGPAAQVATVAAGSQVTAKWKQARLISYIFICLELILHSGLTRKVPLWSTWPVWTATPFLIAMATAKSGSRLRRRVS